jgi:hypothetical protein
MKKGLLFLSAGMLVLASCGRYEEGPGFTLRSKKARLAGDWKIKEITVNGSTTDDGYPTLPTGTELNFSFEKDGNCTLEEVYVDDLGAKISDSEKYTWELKDDSLVLKDAEGYRDALRIVRLTNKEFWIDITETYNGQTDVSMYKFESK